MNIIKRKDHNGLKCTPKVRHFWGAYLSRGSIPYRSILSVPINYRHADTARYAGLFCFKSIIKVKTQVIDKHQNAA